MRKVRQSAELEITPNCGLIGPWLQSWRPIGCGTSSHKVYVKHNLQKIIRCQPPSPWPGPVLPPLSWSPASARPGLKFIVNSLNSEFALITTSLSRDWRLEKNRWYTVLTVHRSLGDIICCLWPTLVLLLFSKPMNHFPNILWFIPPDILRMHTWRHQNLDISWDNKILCTDHKCLP